LTPKAFSQRRIIFAFSSFTSKRRIITLLILTDGNVMRRSAIRNSTRAPMLFPTVTPREVVRV